MSREPTRRRATLTDIAAAAGVTKGTVSKALNGRDDISPETRERVLAVAAELGYHPAAQSGLDVVRRAIAVVFDIPASPYVLGVFEGVLAAATEQGVDLLTRLAPAGPARTQRAAAREWIAQQRAAGAIGILAITLSRPDALIDAATGANLPFVIVDPVDTLNPSMVSVGSSNWAGARTATEHLIGLGHRRIGWIGGPDSSDAARDRLYGYQAAMDAARIPVDPALVRTGLFDVATGATFARELLGVAERPTAIMAADDEIAVGVLTTAHAMGLRVPEDLSVMGFDDTPQAAWTSPPLTTVHQHLDGMGAMGVQTIVSMAEGREPSSRHVELATSLTVRESTGPVPAGA